MALTISAIARRVRARPTICFQASTQISVSDIGCLAQDHLQWHSKMTLFVKRAKFRADYFANVSIDERLEFASFILL